MQRAWSDNPIALWAWRRRWRFLGVEMKAAAAAFLLGALYGFSFVLLFEEIQRALPYWADIVFGTHYIAPLFLAVYIAVAYSAWARGMIESEVLRDVYLAGVPAPAAAWGLLLHFLLPYLAFGVGLLTASLLWTAITFVGDFPYVRPTIHLVALSFFFLFSCFCGIILRNSWDQYFLFLRHVWNAYGTRSRYLAVILLGFTLPIAGIAAVVAVPAYLLLFSFALFMCVVSGDGVQGYLTLLTDHPLFEDEESF